MPSVWQKPPDDSFQQLLLKAIPSEVIGVYLAIQSVIPVKGRSAALMWIILGLCTAVTPVFLWKRGVKSDPANPANPKAGVVVTQYIIATIALPVWLMSIPGSAWWTIDGWEPWYGGLAIIAYGGLFAPGIAFLATRVAD